MNVRNRRFFSLSVFTMTLAALTTFSSCSDDDEPSFAPDLPAEGGSNLKKVSRTGGIINTAYDWEFSYSGPRMSYAAGVIRDADHEIDRSHRYESQIHYGNHRVEVVNSTREDINIILNGSNCIERMTVGKNIYNFQYKNGHLSSWQKVVFENSFGQAVKYESSAVLKYENEDLKSIEFTGPDNVKVTTTFTPDVRNNLNGLLPETVANEMGCLGFEHLYYAGLMGRPTAHLVKSISVNHPEDQEQCYTINFQYSVKGNNTSLCTYQTPSGEPVSVIYTY